MRKVTAIFQTSMLEKVEEALCKEGVGGFTVTAVEGCGEYKNFYTHDHKSCHTRVEVFIEEGRAETIAEAMVNAAHIGLEGDGIVAVLPVESFYRIRTKSKITC